MGSATVDCRRSLVDASSKRFGLAVTEELAANLVETRDFVLRLT